MAKDKNDSMTIRTGSEEKKKSFKDRSKELKANGYTQSDIFEAGLLALEKGYGEQQILYKKNKMIAERDNALHEVIEKNQMIEAYNRQLKDRYSNRYKELDVNDNIKKIYDSEGNELKN